MVGLMRAAKLMVEALIDGKIAEDEFSRSTGSRTRRSFARPGDSHAADGRRHRRSWQAAVCLRISMHSTVP